MALLVAVAAAGAARAQDVPAQSPPPPPQDHAADALFDAAAMARARAALHHENGGMAVSQVMIDQFEARGGGDYAWEAKGWWGGDSDRLALETRGEGPLPGGSTAPKCRRDGSTRSIPGSTCARACGKTWRRATVAPMPR
jgi:copper resistance protein B